MLRRVWLTTVSLVLFAVCASAFGYYRIVSNKRIAYVLGGILRVRDRNLRCKNDGEGRTMRTDAAGVLVDRCLRGRPPRAGSSTSEDGAAQGRRRSPLAAAAPSPPQGAKAVGGARPSLSLVAHAKVCVAQQRGGGGVIAAAPMAVGWPRGAERTV